MRPSDVHRGLRLASIASRRVVSSSLAVVALVLFGGCEGACGREAADEAPARPGLRLAGGPGCRFDAVIADRLPDGFDCASASGEGFESAALGVSGGLRGFCRLRLPEGQLELGTEAALAAARARLPGGARVSPDCVVVTPLGAGADTGSRFERAAGRPVGQVDLEGAPVRVAVVDTPPGTRHGDRVAQAVRALGCATRGGRACAVEVTREVALGRRDPRLGADAPGAYRGSLSELAAAIDRALHATDRDRRLIVNLSLGWDPAAAPELTDPRRADSAAVAAVHRALQLVGCRQALAVAASGSELGFPTSPRRPGPVWPAAWTVTSRPPEETCLALLPELGPYDESAPFVVAAGAVGDFEDFEGEEARPLALQRRGGAPTVYAYGRGPGGDRGPGLVGTSVAAAAVSASLAWTWVTIPPSEGAGDLVHEMVQSGVHLRHPPRVEIPLASVSSARRGRFVRPCRVLDETCGGGACGFTPDGESWCAPPPPPPALPDAMVRVLPSPEGVACEEAPRVTVFDARPRARKRACAAHTAGHPGVRPFSVRRGAAPSCARCAGRAVPGERVVELALALAPDALPPAYLVFTTGKQAAVHPVDALALEPGGLHRLRLDLPGPVPRGLEARVFFRDPEGGLVAEDVALRRR